MSDKNRILIVDDDVRIRSFLKELIVQNGYEALEASDAEETLQIMIQDPPIDLVIADIKIPDLNGIDLLKRIKNDWEDVEVIMITGYESISTAKDALHCGAYDYVSKPIEDVNKFMNIVENALEGQLLKQEREELLKSLEQKNLQLEKTVDELNQKRSDLDSMVKDLDITLGITQKISSSMTGQSSLDSLTPDMYKLFDCYAWGIMNVVQEFDSFKGDLNLFLRYDLSGDKIEKIKANIEKAYRKYGELNSTTLSISSQNIIGKAPSCERHCQINLPMISQDNIYGMTFVYSSEIEKLPEKKLHLFSIIVRQLAALKNVSLLEKMEKLSVTDELTGIYNRRGINEKLEHEFYQNQHYKLPFAFGIFDIDDFKEVNDTYGHPAGDKILKQLTDIMERYSRHTDIMGRYGGEEFAFILPNTDFKGAYAFGEKLRKKVAENKFNLDGKTENITISIGIACLDADSQIDIDELISHADKALYKAKNSGKNRTCMYHEKRK